MNALDWVIVTILIVSVLSAAKTGLVVQVCSLAGAAAGLILACWNYQRPLPWLSGWIRPPALAEVVSFLLIALATMVAAGLLGRLLRWSIRSIGLGWLDRLAGAAFGLAKGAVIVLILVVALAAFAPKAGFFRGSAFAPAFLAAAHGTAWASPEHLSQRINDGVHLLRTNPNRLFTTAPAVP
jgi:membrane protein required for colicin V production